MTGIVEARLFSPSLSPDGLTLFFAANQPADLFFATRSQPSSTVFSAGSPLTALNSAYSDVTPGLSADGLELFFATDPSGSGYPRDIMVATRATPAEPFIQSALLVAGINTAFRENSPWQSGNRLELLFASDRPGATGAEDIWHATRSTASDSFSNPVPLAELNTTSDDATPSLSADGLTVYFVSNRPGGVGGRDLWFAERPTLEAPFGAATNLVVANSPSVDTDPALSPDGTELLFASDRSGDTQIWRAPRQCLVSGP